MVALLAAALAVVCVALGFAFVYVPADRFGLWFGRIVLALAVALVAGTASLVAMVAWFIVRRVRRDRSGSDAMDWAIGLLAAAAVGWFAMAQRINSWPLT